MVTSERGIVVKQISSLPVYQAVYFCNPEGKGIAVYYKERDEISFNRERNVSVEDAADIIRMCREIREKT